MPICPSTGKAGMAECAPAGERWLQWIRILWRNGMRRTGASWKTARSILSYVTKCFIRGFRRRIRKTKVCGRPCGTAPLVLVSRPRERGSKEGTLAGFLPWPGGRVQGNLSEGSPGAFSFSGFFLAGKKKPGRRRQTSPVGTNMIRGRSIRPAPEV